MKPFDLQTALQHPNWVRHADGTRAARVEYRPEVDRRYRVRIEWLDGATGTYPEDSDLIGMDPPEVCQCRKHEFVGGIPSDNGFKFCPFCGKEIST